MQKTLTEMEAYYADYRPVVRLMLGYILKHEPAFIEDAEQDVLLRCWLNRHTVTETTKMREWVKAVARNYCCDLIRRKLRYRENMDKIIAACTDVADDLPHEIVESAELRVLAGEVIDTLSPVSQRILVTRYLGNLDVEETAAKLQVPIGTVKSRSWRAREKVERKLRAYVYS